MSRLKAAFFGLGAMGSRIAGRINRHGRLAAPLGVWNRSRDRTRRHVEVYGTHCLGSLSRTTREEDVVFLCLSDSEAVYDVVLGKNGLGQSLAPGAIVVDCTSGCPEAGRILSQELQQVEVEFIEAPVSGGPAGAESGSLTTMVAGKPSVLARVRPLLSTYASRIVHTGETPGSAYALKAVNNVMSAANLLMASEALLTLQSCGVSPSVALESINETCPSPATRFRIPEESRYVQVMTRRFAYGCELHLMAKDVQQGADILASEPAFKVLPVVAAEFANALSYLGPTVDETEAVRYLESLCGWSLCADADGND